MRKLQEGKDDESKRRRGKRKGKVGRMKEGRKDVTSGKMRNYLFHLDNTCGLHSIENFSHKRVFFKCYQCSEGAKQD